MLLASPDQPVSQPLEVLLPQRKGVIHGLATEGKHHLKKARAPGGVKKTDTNWQEPNKFPVHGESPEGIKNSNSVSTTDRTTTDPKVWR